ncbi:MAG: lipoyl synthase [Acidimicrobiia bacterium]
MALPTAAPASRVLTARWLGRVHYKEAYDLQKALFERRGGGLTGDYLLLLEHPHVYTLGRRSKPEHLLLAVAEYETLGAEVIQTDRGGAITYHGPGQLVAYPIIQLNSPDVVGYVRSLEEAVIRLLGELGIEAKRSDKNSGVWVNERKICAIGVRVGRRTTMHGLALNVSTELSYFDKIVPCGITDAGVTSIEAETGARLDPADLAKALAEHLASVLDLGSLDFAGVGGGVPMVGQRKRTIALKRSGPPRSAEGQPRPSFLRVKARMGSEYRRIQALVRDLALHTVCQEARCPNIYECWSQGTATVMILGDTCTRACGFCNVKTGKPRWFDDEEPERVAMAVDAMGLDHAVVTSVARDDLEDGGASAFAATIRAIRRRIPRCRVEVLIPDFKGDRSSLATVLNAEPDVLNHNIETVARLQRAVRGAATYARSLTLLARASAHSPRPVVKSGLMVGLGETFEEVIQTMADLKAVGVDVLTVGQYLQPSCNHLEVQKWWPREAFEEIRRVGLEMGFTHVEAGPLVRSSYHAKAAVESAVRRRIDNATACSSFE